MKVKSYLKSVFAVAISAVMLSGCYPTGETSLDSYAESAGIEELDEQAPGVEVNLTLPENTPKEVPVLRIKEKTFDYDYIKSIFIDGKTIVQHEEGNPQGRFFDAADDGTSIYVNKGEFNLRTETHSNDKIISSVFVKEINAEKVFTDVSLPSFSREDAVEKAKQLLDDLEISGVSEPDIYAVTPKNFNEFYKTYFEDESVPDFNENDGYYILNFEQWVEGLPITPAAINFPKDKLESFGDSRILIAVDENGYIRTDFMYVVDNDYELGENYEIKISAEEAVKRAILSFGTAPAENRKREITSCQLVYAPITVPDEDGVYTMYPVWRVAIEVTMNTDEPNNVHKTSKFFNAQTGNVIKMEN